MFIFPMHMLGAIYNDKWSYIIETNSRIQQLEIIKIVKNIEHIYILLTF